MERLTTDLIASSSEFRRQQQSIVDKAKSEAKPVAILSHSKLTGYFVPAECVELIDKSETLSLGDMALAKVLMEKHKKNLDSLSKR